MIFVATVEKIQDLVQHFAVLCRDTYQGFNCFIFFTGSYQRCHPNGLWLCAKTDDDFHFPIINYINY